MNFFSFLKTKPISSPSAKSSLNVAQARRNIIVFGERVAGKSSIIHLLTKSSPAPVANQDIDCAFQSQKYEYGDFTIYETRSATNGSSGRVSPADGIRNLVSLLKSLEDGINLLIFVFRKDRIKETTEQHYNLIVKGICQGAVLVIMVVSNCEMDSSMEGWWNENKLHFDGYGMSFLDVISGTAADPDDHLQFLRQSIEERREETRCRLEESMRKLSLQNAWKMDEWADWVKMAVKEVWRMICPFKIIDMVPDLGEILSLHGDLSHEEANVLANDIVFE